MIDALAKESVIYRAIEGVESIGESTRADQRFVEIIMRSIETEHEETFGRLAQRFDAAGLAELGGSFSAARDKLALLEEAKAA